VNLGRTEAFREMSGEQRDARRELLQEKKEKSEVGEGGERGELSRLEDWVEEATKLCGKNSRERG